MDSLTQGGLKKNLGEILVETGLLSREDLEKALELQPQQGRRLGDLLVQQSFITSEELAMALSIQLDVPFIDLKRHTVQPCALQMIPEETARKHALLPLDIIDDSLVVVMADPEDVRVVEDLQAQSRMRVEPALGIESDIREAIDRSYSSNAEIQKQVSQFTPASDQQGEARDNLEISPQTPIVQTLDLLIAQAVRDRASDVHIEPQESRLRVRYRIDGVLKDAATLPLSAQAPLVSRLKIMTGMNIAEQRRPQDGQFTTKVEGREIDVRAATVATTYGERVTLRILDRLRLFTLTELGFLPDSMEKYCSMLRKPFGMILVSGPTGAGKTTTLYASLSEFNRSERNIMTVEDPVEYHFMDINQIAVNPKAGITFAGGLRTIMRHDPDVILVGEIRDTETANVAVQAALTGHLVLSSIHANDAVGVLFRLMDLGVEPYLISSTLVGTITQRMVRRVCPRCRMPSEPSVEELAAYRAELGDERIAFYHGAGCNFCANTGYLGRTGVFEILDMSEEIRRLLLSHASADEIRGKAVSEGMMPMRHDGMLKVKEGITTQYEVMRNVLSAE
ncbi:MAG: GspE/PulE family protein [Chloroflexota bacterium]